MNTINLISAISVLACNVSMATIPKQANSNDYGDIVVIDRDITYSQSNMHTSSYGIGNTAKDYSVYRSLGSYSDDKINFYSERYYFESSWNSEGDVISFGYTTFATIAIYENTLLSSFQVRNNVNYSDSNALVNGVCHVREYNKTLNFTNLGNTMYFSNYNLNWKENDLFPLVATCSDSYLSLFSFEQSRSNSSINSVLNWAGYSRDFNNEHGSINFAFTQLFVIDSSNVAINISNLSVVNDGLKLTYKYYINNPTYEVIDLPNVMLSILTMPFTFFSQAFNLTLFPNTPYAINVGHTILIIVGVIGSIYLIKYLVGIFKG